LHIFHIFFWQIVALEYAEEFNQILTQPLQIDNIIKGPLLQESAGRLAMEGDLKCKYSVYWVKKKKNLHYLFIFQGDDELTLDLEIETTQYQTDTPDASRFVEVKFSEGKSYLACYIHLIDSINCRCPW
jgi:hypothetical protein